MQAGSSANVKSRTQNRDPLNPEISTCQLSSCATSSSKGGITEEIVQPKAMKNEDDTSSNIMPQARKSYSVDSFLKDRRLSGYPNESIEQTLMDYHICFLQAQRINRD